MQDPTLPQFQAENSPSAEEEDNLPPGVCAQCRIQPSQPEYAAPLCITCREGLINFPIPVWVRALGALVVLVMAFSLVTYPGALQAGVAFERGQKAEKAGDFARAVAEYRRAVKRYPDSTGPLVRLTVAEYRAGNLKETVALLDRLQNRDLGSEEAVNELSGIMRELENLAGAEQTPSQAPER
jgi:hypothetical protein